MIVIHSFLTDGLYEWGKLFLSTFQRYHSEEFSIVLSTRNLTRGQIEEYSKIYNDVTILNEKMKVTNVAKDIGMSRSETIRMKRGVEERDTNDGNFRWKLYVSVMERYRKSIREVFDRYVCGHILHFDIDMYIRGRIDRLVNLVKENDVSLRFRNDKSLKGKICGNLIGIAVNENGRMFMDSWIERINNTGIRSMPRGYGQISLYETYRELRNKLMWGNINELSLFDRNLNKKALIWEGNNGSKSENLKNFLRDF